MVTVITKTIGPSGRDYTTFTLAEADVTNVGTSGDLVANDEAIVFEADAGDYSETLDFNTSGGLTCDATRNVTWTHATSAGHGGQFESGVNLIGACNIREDHAVVDGLSVSPSSGGAAGIFSAPEGVFLRNMMVYSTNSYAIRLDRGATAAFPGVVENCVCKSDSLRPFDIRSEGSGVDAHWRVINTTVFTAGSNTAFQVGSSSSDTLHLELTNVLVLGARAYFAASGSYTLSLTGSNNFGPGSPNPFPAAIQGSPYPITATTDVSPGVGDFAIYESSTGQLVFSDENSVVDQGVGPSANSDVPTTGILGGTRSGATTQPGAFATLSGIPAAARLSLPQVLPADETFEAPDFLAPTSGGTHYCTAQFTWYFGYDPSFTINATTHSTCPWRGVASGAIGPLFVEPLGSLYIPQGSASPIPCRVHRIGPATQELAQGHAAFLARAEDSFDYSDLDIKVVFGLEATAYAGLLGADEPNGGLPQPDEATDDNHASLGFTYGGTWTPGGGAVQIDPTAVGTAWAAFTGCALYFRVGKGGQPVTYDNATTGEDYTRGLNGYVLGLYPEINSGQNRVDLIAEVWQFESATAITNGTTPRLLIKQTIDGGASNLQVEQPYHLRVEVNTNLSSEVEITAYLGQYKLGTTVHDELQLFLDGAFANDTYSVGTSVTHTASTGLVTDAHSNKIDAHTERTIGWQSGVERLENLAPRLSPSTANPTPQNAAVVEGLYRVRVNRKHTGEVLYREKFERSFQQSGLSAVAPITGSWGTTGRSARGLFTFDTAGYEAGAGNAEIGQALLWGDTATDTTPNDYVKVDYDLDDSDTGVEPANVLRQFVHLRPSTQLYNHHRKIEFKPGADDPSGSATGTANVFEIGVQLRGNHTGISTSGVTLALDWNTDFASVVTFARLRILNRTASFTDVLPGGSVIASKTWSSTADVATFNSTFPLYDGNWHSLALKVEAYTGATDPNSAAVYEVRLDGTSIQLDDAAPPYQSDTTTPFAVIENGPTHIAGITEAFSFRGPAEFDGSGYRNYDLYQFRNWTEQSVAADPGTLGSDDQASVVLPGEGSAVGSLNLSTGALGISGGGVYDVETEVEVSSSYPARRTEFESGHVYTSPMLDVPRRTWRVTVRAATLAVMQSLQTFYNSHNGTEIPFTFVVPITHDGYSSSALTDTTEQVVAFFTEDVLTIAKVGPNTYDISMSIAETVE